MPGTGSFDNLSVSLMILLGRAAMAVAELAVALGGGAGGSVRRESNDDDEDEGSTMTYSSSSDIAPVPRDCRAGAWSAGAALQFAGVGRNFRLDGAGGRSADWAAGGTTLAGGKRPAAGLSLGGFPYREAPLASARPPRRRLPPSLDSSSSSSRSSSRPRPRRPSSGLQPQPPKWPGRPRPSSRPPSRRTSPSTSTRSTPPPPSPRAAAMSCLPGKCPLRSSAIHGHHHRRPLRLPTTPRAISCLFSVLLFSPFTSL